MPTMNEMLAKHYGTDKLAGVATQPTPEDLEKAAQMDLFSKLAAANNIDLSKLSDAQVAQLWNDTFAKQAGEMPPQFAAHAKGHDGKDGKKEHEEHGEEHDLHEKAKKEHEEKKAWAQKLAEADYAGRTMAHAYVQELNLIAEKNKTAAAGTPAVNTAANGEWRVEVPKLASAIDQLALARAWEIVQEHNKTAAPTARIEEKTAAEKLVTAFSKGVADSGKTASAPDHKVAVEIRALEGLEAAGYPVDWSAK